ncbi:hypothetical protein QJS10_CPB21g00883 [Acorus calamus]|uniref:Uncharacterized protein n=1 Tax=Acorus calamus TaxID=4465 RepID=A0AAV9C270_ACOCL|nr:hypothetical protein QJS10_CPB21g00883 [Acorus calamus]
MEDSTTQSSMNKSFPSKETTASPSSEESGWTKYFEDFISSSQTQNMSIEGSSLVSDAASCVVVASKTPATAFKKLSFKKRRRRGGGGGVDEPLEDTASSPVNSPKVGGLNQLDENPRKKDDTIEKTKEGEIGPGDPVEVHGNETEEMVFVGNECSELKKRGLCLVPLSMLVNYVG